MLVCYLWSFLQVSESAAPDPDHLEEVAKAFKEGKAEGVKGRGTGRLLGTDREFRKVLEEVRDGNKEMNALSELAFTEQGGANKQKDHFFENTDEMVGYIEIIYSLSQQKCNYFVLCNLHNRLCEFLAPLPQHGFFL